MIFLIFLILIPNIGISTGKATKCNLPSQCHLKRYMHTKYFGKSIKFICSDFKTSSMLKKDIGKCLNGSNFNLYFRLFGQKKILDKSFDLRNVFELNGLYDVEFRNIKGFQLDAYDKYYEFHSENINEVTFSYSDFVFFSQNNLQITKCSDLKSKSVIRTIFQFLKRPINYTFYWTSFGRQEICPLVFSNTTIGELHFSDSLVNTFYKKNILRFEKINEKRNNDEINSNIETLRLVKFDKIDIDESLLNKNVFKQLRHIVLIGEINSIQIGVFKPFKKMRKLLIHGLFYPKLVRRHGIEWMREFNMDVRINLANRPLLDVDVLREKFVLIDLATIIPWNGAWFSYESVEVKSIFPDEDFCLYANFPFEQAVILNYDRIFKMSARPCTLVWLIKYDDIYFKYLSDIDLFEIKLYYYFFLYRKNLTYHIKKCNFEKR